MKTKVIKFILAVSGSLLILNAVLMAFTSNINVGILTELVLGFMILLYGVLFDKSVRRIPKQIKGVFWGGVSVVTAFIVFLLSYGTTDNISGGEDAVIVLGSGIRGELLTVGLKNRLDRAVECYRENPDVLILSLIHI